MLGEVDVEGDAVAFEGLGVTRTVGPTETSSGLKLTITTTNVATERIATAVAIKIRRGPVRQSANEIEFALLLTSPLLFEITSCR